MLWHPLAAFAECPGEIAVQVLGSGGPDANDARASASYVVWIDGKARLLVDAGGGVFLRFGEAKAKFETLDAIAITHLQADHVADLVLSHNMARSLNVLPNNLAVIGGIYAGPTIVARD